MNFNFFNRKEFPVESNNESETAIALKEQGISPSVFKNPIFRDVVIEKLYQFRKKDLKLDPEDGQILPIVNLYIPQILETVLKVISHHEINKPIVFEDLNLKKVPKQHERFCREFFTSIENSFSDDKDLHVELVLEIRQQIESVANFEDLYQVLNNLKEIPGSKEVYSAEEVIYIIEKLRQGKEGVEIHNLPNTFGLRNKVKELLKLEK